MRPRAVIPITLFIMILSFGSTERKECEVRQVAERIRKVKNEAPPNVGTKRAIISLIYINQFFGCFGLRNGLIVLIRAVLTLPGTAETRNRSNFRLIPPSSRTKILAF